MDISTFVLTSALGAIIIYFWRSLTHFKRHGIPQRSPWPIIGNMGPVLLRRVHFIEYISEFAKNWPDAKYVGFYMFHRLIVIVRDIDLVKTVTLKNFDSFSDHDSFISEDTDPLLGKNLLSLKGAKWKEARAALSPAFTPLKLKQLFGLMDVCAANFLEFIANNVDQGNNDIEAKEAFSKYTIDVIATSAFGITTNSLKNPNNKFYALGKQVMHITVMRNIKLMLYKLMPVLSKIVNLQVFDAELTDYFYGLIKSTVESRRREGIVRPDLLQLMIEFEGKNDCAKMDITEMTSQAFIFFLGGFESSALLMSYVAIELAKNQDIQDKLIEQIDEIMIGTNGNPGYDDINSMIYFDAILYETLRYYPITGFMDRVCAKDFQLPPTVPGNKPYMVRVNDVLWFPSYDFHTNPEFYDNPKTFDPDRFLDKKVNTNMPTYLGFGIGPRSCIGNKFALLECKLVLFRLLSRFRLEMSSKLKLPITYVKNNFLAIAEGGFWVKVVSRT